MIDILEDVNGDLDLSGGDIHYGESTRQHQKDILLARKGEYRLNIGGTIGIEDYLDDEGPEAMQAEIRIKMAKDGMTVRNIELESNGKLKLEASYE